MLKFIRQKYTILRQLLRDPFSLQKNPEIINWAVKTPRRASFYYYFFSSNFFREHQSVLYGTKCHLCNDANSLAISSKLRRNLHRLEKGLTTYPIKPVFAIEYILETIQILELFLKNYEDEYTLKWAVDVLIKYFSVVKKEDDIALAEKQFIELKNQHSFLEEIYGNIYYGPYTTNEIEPSLIGYKDFMKLCHQRHSIRWYEKKSVPVQLVQQAIEAALSAPSACNRQPFRFVLIKSAKKLKEALSIPIGCATFASNITFFVALIGDLSAYFDERDRHLIYIDGGLAAMNFMLSLETMKLASCPINWPDIEEREAAASVLFNMKKYERGIMFFSVGYPLMEGGVAFSARKQVSQVTSIL